MRIRLGICPSSVLSFHLLLFILPVHALPLPLPTPSTTNTYKTSASTFTQFLQAVSTRNNASSTATGLTQGWTPQPNSRGTLDIIWSCVFTVFLCSWSVLCVHVPARTDTHWAIFWRRFYLTGLGFLAPEIIPQAPLDQRFTAGASFRELHASAVQLNRPELAT